MADKLQAHIKQASDGRDVLFYLEPSGDEGIIHMILNLTDIGQADIKLSGPIETMETSWSGMEADGFRHAAEGVLKTAQEIEGKFL